MSVNRSSRCFVCCCITFIQQRMFLFVAVSIHSVDASQVVILDRIICLSIYFCLQAGASMWNHIQDHLGHTPLEYSTRKKMCQGIGTRDLTIHTEQNSKDIDPTLISSDVLDVRCKDSYGPTLKVGTRISLPSLPYRSWKVTRRATRERMHRRFSGHQVLTMYISSGSKEIYEVPSSVTILLVFVGLCLVTLQSPNQVIMSSLPLQRCVFGLENGSE